MKDMEQNTVLFFGQDLSDDECEGLMLERFGSGDRVFKKRFKRELNLMQTKWFDYRILHPVIATYLFAWEYTKVYQRYYAMTIDYGKSAYVRGFKGGDAWLSTNSGGFVNARQKADELGMPYGFFISNAFDFLYIKKWKHIPRPCHLYAADVIEVVTQRWSEFQRAAMTLAQDDFFKNIENAERPEFAAHLQWVNNRLDKSSVAADTRELLREQGYSI